MITENDLLEQWKKDEQAPFQGWDFSYLKGRWEEESPPWSYESIAIELLKKADSVLDMGTGGGEVFSSFAPFPKKAMAIEGYEPNVVVARKRLGPLGVGVIDVDESRELPFNDGEFDLVFNRHGGFNVDELSRILVPGGTFLTEQVDSRNLEDLTKEFGIRPRNEHNTSSAVRRQLTELGFKMKDFEEWTGRVVFKDVGAIVYFLKAIPWIVDDFSVRKHLPYLVKLQEKIEKESELSFSTRRFLVVAER